MIKTSSVLLAALLIFPFGSNARGDQGDDLIEAWGSGSTQRLLELAKPAAQKDDFIAQFILGRVYEEGRGAPKDTAEAKKWFQKALSQAKPAADRGDARAQFVLGRMYAGGWALPKDQAQAVALYRKAAEQGNPWAQGALGSGYASGEGVPKDENEAVVWFRKAADQGNSLAQFNLGLMYVNGQGVSKDEKEGAAWFRKAADQGSAHGQHSLGSMYMLGQGVPKDVEEATGWFRKAADQGNADAQARLGAMYESGSGVSNDDKAAVAWYRKAAEQGNTFAQTQLGTMYETGRGVWKNDKNAVAWYRKAADQDHAYAKSRLGMMYSSGKGVRRDEFEAVAWYRKAAAQADELGQFLLGNEYRYGGQAVPKDKSEAIAWFRKAADQGNTQAKNALIELEGSSAGQTNTPTGVSKEDLRDMIQAAMKTKEETQAPAAPKAIASDVDTPGYTTPENPDNFAVVIGVEKYTNLPAADFAERDAESVRAHLMAMGYPARNILFASGQQATRAKIAQSVNTWLPGRVTPTSSVFFYYSGHGAPDPQTNQAYLVPMDGDPEDLDSTAYPIKLLYEKLGKLKSKQVIVALDSCFSGAGGRSVLAKGTRPLVGKIDMGGLPDTVVALTASGSSQISGTIEEQGHGAFTYWMLKGLEGGAKNGAGRVTAQSLHDYLTPKVRDAARLSNREQTPQLMNAKRASAALR